MSHELEIKNDGSASFAYNRRNGDPWHFLGEPVDGNQPLKVMLQTVGADFVAYKSLKPIQGEGNFGLVEESDKFMVLADRMLPDTQGVTSLRTQCLGVVGEGYQIVQYEEAGEKALAVAGASDGEAVVDTMGLLYNGRRFFCFIDLGDLYIDPAGINDRITRGLGVYTSHDGSISVTYAMSDVRWVCANTVNLGISTSHRVFRAKHTSSVKERMAEAQKVLGISTEWTKAFQAKAERLLSVNDANGLFGKTLNKVFPVPTGATQRKQDNALDIHTQIAAIYENDNNAKNFGRNGWTIYNAIGEYLDHARSGKPDEKALASMQIGSWVDKKKAVAAEYILASV